MKHKISHLTFNYIASFEHRGVMTFAMFIVASFSFAAGAAENWGRINYSINDSQRRAFASSWIVKRKSVPCESALGTRLPRKVVYSFAWDPGSAKVTGGMEHRGYAFTGNFRLPQKLIVLSRPSGPAMHVRTLWSRSPLTTKAGEYTKGTGEWLKRAESSVFSLLQALGEFDWQEMTKTDTKSVAPVFWREVPEVKIVYETRSNRLGGTDGANVESLTSKVVSRSFEHLMDLHRDDDKVHNNNSFVGERIQWGMVSDKDMPPVYSTFVSDYLRIWVADSMDNPTVAVITKTQHGWGNQIPFSAERIEIIPEEQDGLGILRRLVEYPDEHIAWERGIGPGLGSSESAYEKDRSWRWRYELRLTGKKGRGEIVGHRRYSEERRGWFVSDLVFTNNGELAHFAPERVIFRRDESLRHAKQSATTIHYQWKQVDGNGQNWAELLQLWTVGLYASGMMDGVIPMETHRQDRDSVVPIAVHQWPWSDIRVSVDIGKKTLEFSALDILGIAKNHPVRQCCWVWHRKVFHDETPLDMFVAHGAKAGTLNEKCPLGSIWRIGDFWRAKSIGYPIRAGYTLKNADFAGPESQASLEFTRIEPTKHYFRRSYITRMKRSDKQWREEQSKRYIPRKTTSEADSRILAHLTMDEAVKLGDALQAIERGARLWAMSVEAKPGTPIKWDKIKPFINKEFKDFSKLPRYGGGTYDLGTIGGTIRFHLPAKKREY